MPIPTETPMFGLETVRDGLDESPTDGNPSGPITLVLAASPVSDAVGCAVTLDTTRVIERLQRGPSLDARMSRHHATVSVAPDGIRLRDGSPGRSGWKRSANGTTVNGHTLDDHEVVIRPGDRILTGQSPWLVVSQPPEVDSESLVLGVSAAIGTVRDEVALVAELTAERFLAGERVHQSLLVTGPRGSGKQVVAREAHRLLANRLGKPIEQVPFRQVSAPSLADGTVAADLFGVTARYATGVAAREGYFQQAHGGVLFLDEVGDTPAAEQAKLLNALQEREVVPFGGHTPVPFDVLVIAATNRPVRGLDTTLRPDLIDRLARFSVELPALAERAEDIPLLVHQLLARHGYEGPVPHRVVDALLSQAWPGNVRELDAALERLAALHRLRHQPLDTRLLARALPGASLSRSTDTSPPRAPTSKVRARRPPRDEFLAMLDAVGWNKAEAARRLNTYRKQVNRWLAHYGIETPEGSP